MAAMIAQLTVNSAGLVDERSWVSVGLETHPVPTEVQIGKFPNQWMSHIAPHRIGFILKQIGLKKVVGSEYVEVPGTNVLEFEVEKIPNPVKRV